jgi:glutamine synthetase
VQELEQELAAYLGDYPNTTMLEIMLVDMNGIARGKRVPREEFEAFFAGKLSTCASTPLCNTLGDISELIGFGTVDGDPDDSVIPVSGSLSPVPWLASDTAQVLASFQSRDGIPSPFDPRTVLQGVLDKFAAAGLKPVVATEMEFYLLEPGDGEAPVVHLPKVPGTGLRQEGSQYALPQDLWDLDAFLEDMRSTCELQKVPMSTVISEFSPGQLEINVHHVDDPMLACDHAVLLKRAVKGNALKHGMAATFMAKPFADIAGSGMHIHASVYDEQDENIFADSSSGSDPAISEQMRHAVGGLAETMGEAMAIFAPNANSYRRLIPGNFAPLTPNWGFNHRNVSLRIPVSGDSNRRIEHRTAGADSNPYLVMAAVLAGILHGLENRCDPGPMIAEREEIEEEVITLPQHWPDALDAFDASIFLPQYLGKEYCQLFSTIRRDECRAFKATVSDVDYRWYLRTV